MNTKSTFSISVEPQTWQFLIWQKNAVFKTDIPTETIFGKTLIKLVWVTHTSALTYTCKKTQAAAPNPTVWFPAVAFHITAFTRWNTQLSSQLAKSYAMSCCSHDGHRLLPASSAPNDQTSLSSAFAEVNPNAEPQKPSLGTRHSNVWLLKLLGEFI